MMIKRRIHVDGARELVLGLTPKENYSDLRNTRVVDVYDHWANPSEALHEYGLELVTEPGVHGYDGIALAVAHDQFKALAANQIRKFGKAWHMLYYLKNIISQQESDLRL